MRSVTTPSNTPPVTSFTVTLSPLSSARPTSGTRIASTCPRCTWPSSLARKRTRCVQFRVIVTKADLKRIIQQNTEVKKGLEEKFGEASLRFPYRTWGWQRIYQRDLAA